MRTFGTATISPRSNPPKTSVRPSQYSHETPTGNAYSPPRRQCHKLLFAPIPEPSRPSPSAPPYAAGRPAQRFAKTAQLPPQPNQLEQKQTNRSEIIFFPTVAPVTSVVGLFRQSGIRSDSVPDTPTAQSPVDEPIIGYHSVWASYRDRCLYEKPVPSEHAIVRLPVACGGWRENMLLGAGHPGGHPCDG